MNKTHYTKTIISLASATIFPALVSASSPNVILILADDMGYGDISSFNEESKILTPRLDELRSKGIKFTDAHSGSSVSTPSRYGLLTGRYAFRTTLKSGVYGGYSPALIDKQRSTIATMLSEQGYSTACIGKWHLGWDWSFIDKQDNKADFSKPISNGPTTRGFDYFYGMSASLDMAPYVYVENDRPTAVPDRVSVEVSGGMFLQRSGPQSPDFEHSDCLPNFTRRAVKYISEQKGSNKPFFLYLPLTAPHTPILPTPEYQGISKLSPYGDFVVMLDAMVGKITDAVRESGMADNTIIIFTTDNGCSPSADMKQMEGLGHSASYIYRGAKSDIYDGGHRVPLIISWGDRYNAMTVDGITSLTDFYATFADMTGYNTPDNEGEDSFSLWSTLTQTGSSLREAVVHHSIDGSFSIRKGDWKLLFCAGSGGWGYPSLPRNANIIETLPKVQLYNIKSDYAEEKNMEGREKKVVKELSATMRQYILDGRSTPGERQTNETDKEWKQTAIFMNE